ncbi:hypothetical protein SAMN04490202_3329 [Pseudomonas reinekei]|uniref:Uncharacterized protein n=1 Tax=Pseudomonas reinekei TaxID=395598 RepID=A0A1H0QX27_PSERE|nr:ABC-three component system middle component 1 [Pseudomonas reinekei]KAB0482233.1 hypothetical protein F7R15_23405 [Pseudomonas reinekei]SDP21814.1 hypothetical protein SAMN04490202_3329 [Pseudomonas reinekei]
MTDQFSSVHATSPGWFLENLKAAAEQCELQVSDWPELAGVSFRGGEASASTRLSPSDLPAVKYGIKIGRYSVVVGVLPEEPNAPAIRETLRRYRNQCVIARSFLSANQALDLQLMLVGPRGSERLSEWQALALMVERDDRVARKLAWLMPEEEANDGASFGDFLKRTFLARPWSFEGRFSAAALDRLSSASETSISPLPRNVAEEWEQIALGPEEDPMKIVDALINAWKRRLSE